MGKLDDLVDMINEDDFQTDNDSFEDPTGFEMKSMEEIRQEINSSAGPVIADQFVELSCYSKIPASPGILIEVLEKRDDYFSRKCLEKLLERTNAR